MVWGNGLGFCLGFWAAYHGVEEPGVDQVEADPNEAVEDKDDLDCSFRRATLLFRAALSFWAEVTALVLLVFISAIAMMNSFEK